MPNVLANPLLPFGDGNPIRNRRVSQRIRANDGKERIANEKSDNGTSFSRRR